MPPSLICVAKEAESLAVLLSGRYDLPYVDLSRINIDNSAIRLIPEAVSRESKLVVFQINQHTVNVAVQSPNDPKLAPVLAELTRQGFTPMLHIASEYGIAKAWEVYKEVSYAKAEIRGIISDLRGNNE